jgi:hypothetical protein
MRRSALLVAAAVLGVGCRRPDSSGPKAALGATEGRLVAEVLNAASPRAGLARIATRVLRDAGIDVVFYGTADTTVDTTVVLVRRGEPRQGERVAKALGGGRVIVAPDAARRVDVTVWVGREWQVPKGTMVP